MVEIVRMPSDTIEGTVLDALTNRELEGAVVSVTNALTGQLVATQTDSSDWTIAPVLGGGSSPPS